MIILFKYYLRFLFIMNIMNIRNINNALIGCHGLLDIYKEDFYQYYLFFPLFFLFLPENLIYLMIITKSIGHFSSDIIFLPFPFPHILLLVSGIIAYKYRTNNVTLNLVQIYLGLHSINNIIKNDINNEKILLLVLGFIFILNNSFLQNNIHELIYNIDSPLTLKKRLFYSLLCAHIRTNY